MPMPTSLAPGYVKFTYSGVLFPHHATIPVAPRGTPTPGIEPDVNLKDATHIPVSAAMDAFMDVIVPFFPTTVNFGLAEIHLVDAGTGEDTFIYAWNLGRLGTSLVARVAAEQLVWSFKTALGSPYKLYMMEAVEAVNQRSLPPYPAGVYKDLSDYVCGNTSPVYGRSNSYPFVPVSRITKTNDTLRKQQGLA